MLQHFANNSPSTYIHPRLCPQSWAISASDPPCLSWKMLEYCWGVSGHPEVAKKYVQRCQVRLLALHLHKQTGEFLFTAVHSPRDFPILPTYVSWKRREVHTGCKHSHSQKACRRTKKSPPSSSTDKDFAFGLIEEKQVWFLCQRDNSLQRYASGSLRPINLANCKEMMNKVPAHKELAAASSYINT